MGADYLILFRVLDTQVRRRLEGRVMLMSVEVRFRDLAEHPLPVR